MDFATAMRRLEAAGTAQNRKVYARHGVTEPLFGVPYAEIGKLQKEIKADHDLARELWATGNHDARVLATRVADPARVTATQADAWLRDVDNYVLMEDLGRLVARSPVAASRARAWRDRTAEWPASAGWVVTGSLVLAGAIPKAEQQRLAAQIQREIRRRPNRVRHEMNAVLIALGMQGGAVRDRAMKAAAKIGPVEVDHGTTGCVTPIAYQLRCIEDLHAMLKANGDWVPLGAADEQKPAAEGTVEAWGRSPDNPVRGWYGLKKGLRGRFGMYVPPLLEALGLAELEALGLAELEALGLAELEHNPRNNRMRAV